MEGFSFSELILIVIVAIILRDDAIGVTAEVAGLVSCQY